MKSFQGLETDNSNCIFIKLNKSTLVVNKAVPEQNLRQRGFAVV